MTESISIVRNNILVTEAYDTVFKWASHSGGSLFANKDRSSYYIAFNIGVASINVRSERIEVTCTIDDEIAQNLDYIGYFGLAAYNYRDSPRGDDVTFTPAGQNPPVLRYERPGNIQELKNRYG